MEKAVRRKFTDACREGAVKLVTDQGYKIAEAARNLGIHATQLRRRVKQIARFKPRPGQCMAIPTGYVISP